MQLYLDPTNVLPSGYHKQQPHKHATLPRNCRNNGLLVVFIVELKSQLLLASTYLKKKK